MSPEVLENIARCRSEVDLSPRHEMSFASRRALLRSLGAPTFDPKGRSVELSQGKRRRVALAMTVGKRVSPYWARDFGTPQLDQLLELIEKHLLGAVTREEVRKKTDALQGGLSNDPEGKHQAYLAGRAVAGAGWVVVCDELLYPDAGATAEELDHPEDPDLWDPAFFAAGAAAGGMPWTAAFDAAAHRAFWQWYLDDAVPAAWRG